MSYLQHPNSTYVSYDGTSLFNNSLLNQFNYTIYPNGTLSNTTKCVLVFGRYRPTMLSNGTILNGTSCDSPIEPIAVRGGLGIAFAVIFAALILWIVVNMRKHGASHATDPFDGGARLRFRLVERRWMWYWALITAITACVSGFMAIDVDREYITGSSIVLQSVFFWVTLPTCLAAVWEMTRHWGAFEERKILDDDPYAFRTDNAGAGEGRCAGESGRQKWEFWLPLLFYPLAFMTFFLSILRTWTPITKQIATAATDGRFRASTVFSLLALLVIIVSVVGSVRFYAPYQLGGKRPWYRFLPVKIPLCVLGLLVRVAYGFAMVWDLGAGWDVSAMRVRVSVGYLYGLGYIPIAGVLAVMCWAGWVEGNEDLVVGRERREREDNAMREEREMIRKERGTEEVRRGLPPLPPPPRYAP